MNLQKISDKNLLVQIKAFAQSEREVVVKILHHLREIEHRRLFSDLGYRSLFDYAVNELKYSEGQAGRRIQAMRLLKDVPEVEAKIASGELSLSNVHQAQTFFRDMKASEPTRIVAKLEKLEVLAKLENKLVSDAQRELFKLQPNASLPKEMERLVAEDTAEVRFLMDDKLKAKLEEVRSLLGNAGATMSYAELFDAMSDLSLRMLKAKRFGKARTKEHVELVAKAPEAVAKKVALPSTSVAKGTNARYISREVKHSVWQRDGGCCTNCKSTRLLNFDHILPVALGGASTIENLRLLCFSCNQRASVKIFGNLFRPWFQNEYS